MALPLELQRRTKRIGLFTQGVYIEDKFGYPCDEFVISPYYRPLVSSVMISQGLIHDRIEKLALDIFTYYKDDPTELVLLCTLKGACMFFQLLTKQLRTYSACCGLKTRPAYVDNYVKASSYTGETRGEQVEIGPEAKKVLSVLTDKNVLIVEDIIDSGKTMAALSQTLRNIAKPKNVHTVSLIAKRSMWNGFEPEWVGFDIPDEFIVGFGCDLHDHFRDLGHICAISIEGRKMYLGKPSKDEEKSE